jgi:hypothetical protein
VAFVTIEGSVVRGTLRNVVINHVGWPKSGRSMRSLA